MKNETVYRVAVIILAVLVCAAAAVFFALYSSYNTLREDFVSYRSKVALAGDGSSQDLSSLRMELAAAEQARQILEDRIAQLESSSQTDGLDELKEQLNEKDRQIAALKSDLRAAGQGYSVNLTEQIRITSEITEIAGSAPQNAYVKNLRTEQGVPVTDENGEPIYDTVITSPVISVSYRDLNHGFCWTFNERAVFPAGGIEKPALALGLLSQAYLEHEKELAGSGYRPALDLNELIDGDSASSLIAKMLRSGDSEAYSVLVGKYGQDYVTDTLSMYGITQNGDAFTVTAEKACALFVSLYTVAEKAFDPCREAMEALIESDHSVVTGMGFSSPVAHFFIWGDSVYADLAVVCAEKPFACVILTDMAGGGDRVNACLRSICEKIGALHGNFYTE